MSLQDHGQDEQPERNDYEIDKDYRELREQFFTIDPVKFNLIPPTGERVWGVLMEMGQAADEEYPAAVFSLMALYDGTANLYISTGGGLLGAGEYEEPAEAALALVLYADDFLDECEPTQEFPFPAIDHLRFYLLTQDGVFTREIRESELLEQQHPFSPLFNTGHALLTEMRILDEESEENEEFEEYGEEEGDY